MADSKRQCSTCQFFQTAQLSGNGWCTHPKRQTASELKILVRERELACRNTWGVDLWVGDASSSATTPPHAKPPRNPRKGFIFGNRRSDDVVTSVVDATSGTSPVPDSHADVAKTDDVVTLTSMRPEDSVQSHPRPTTPSDDHNAAADADQVERMMHMSRGNSDAVFHARARAVLRRRPTRPMIEPYAGDHHKPADRPLDARRRDQSLGGQAGKPGRGEALDITPPVPRSEVEARGDALSPAAGVDTRFDSVPDVNPEVDLPRLRDFFRTDRPHAHKERGFDGSSPLFSSFDLAHQRAQLVHDANSVNRDRKVNPRIQVPELQFQPAPRRATHDPSTRHNPAVVWDVESELLNGVFQRARAAIEEEPTSLGSDPTGQQPDVDDLSLFDFQPLEREVATPDGEGYAHEFYDFQLSATSGFPNDNIHALDDIEPSAEVLFDDAYSNTSYVRNATPESPRTSWWRSLNFGVRRRYQGTWRHHDTVAEAVNGEFMADDDEYEYLDDESAPSADPGYFPEWERLEEPDTPFVSHPDSLSATSPQSWFEDEIQFPNPQPVAWREAGSLLRASLAEPGLVPNRLAPSDSDAPPAPDNQQLAYDGFVEEQVSPDRAEPSFFAIDEPGGMDEFRSALFGDRQTPAAQSARPEGDIQGPRFAGKPLSMESTPHWVDEGPALVARPADRNANPTIAVHESLSRLSRRRDHHSPTSDFAHHQAAFRSDFDIRDAITGREEEPERVFEVASRVPKSCGTCRSFRPNETGARGWCMNHDAPTYRQMVNADELTCRSSIGFWWLAADTSWIPPVDVIRPETPRTDRLVARSYSQNESERQDERRVRTRNFS